MPDIEIELDDETESRLRALAAERGVTLEELIREAVCQGLARDDEEGTDGETDD